MHFSSILKLKSKTSGEIAALEEIFSTLKYTSGGNLVCLYLLSCIRKTNWQEEFDPKQIFREGLQRSNLKLRWGIDFSQKLDLIPCTLMYYT